MTMNAQTTASGSSASTASATASPMSPRPAVTTSNHASQTSIVPDAAANGTSHCDERTAHQAVAANADASAMSNPTHARS
jgi:hypothetical protein